MTDRERAAAHGAVKQIEATARARAADVGVEATDRDAATVALRQAVALRLALGNWIVTRATAALEKAG